MGMMKVTLFVHDKHVGKILRELHGKVKDFAVDPVKEKTSYTPRGTNGTVTQAQFLEVVRKLGKSATSAEIAKSIDMNIKTVYSRLFSYVKAGSLKKTGKIYRVK